jgi:hypothetical protein
VNDNYVKASQPAVSYKTSVEINVCTATTCPEKYLIAEVVSLQHKAPNCNTWCNGCEHKTLTVTACNLKTILY